MELDRLHLPSEAIPGGAVIKAVVKCCIVFIQCHLGKMSAGR